MAIADGDAAETIYDAQGEIIGVRFNPRLQGKELAAAKAMFFEMMRAAINVEEQS
jgi:hypothetical protein